MKVDFSNKGTTLIASIVGELDHHTAEYIKQKMDYEIIKSTTKNVIFDFSNVTFMDSSGIGVILGRYKNVVKLNGKAAVASVNSQIKRLFDMSGIQKIMPVFDSVENAVNKM